MALATTRPEADEGNEAFGHRKGQESGASWGKAMRRFLAFAGLLGALHAGTLGAAAAGAGEAASWGFFGVATVMVILAGVQRRATSTQWLPSRQLAPPRR